MIVRQRLKLPRMSLQWEREPTKDVIVSCSGRIMGSGTAIVNPLLTVKSLGAMLPIQTFVRTAMSVIQGRSMIFVH
jgi:hypothetical protein